LSLQAGIEKLLLMAMVTNKGGLHKISSGFSLGSFLCIIKHRQLVLSKIENLPENQE
jgi:hypothetical protein